MDGGVELAIPERLNRIWPALAPTMPGWVPRWLADEGGLGGETAMPAAAPTRVVIPSDTCGRTVYGELPMRCLGKPSIEAPDKRATSMHHLVRTSTA